MLPTLGSVPLALFAAITWGGGDFAGGMGVKRSGGALSGALRVVLLSHTTSLFALTFIALLRHDVIPHGRPLLWALAAGFFGGASVLSFYVCLARGAMGSSAAISGLLAAAIPSLVLVGLDGKPAGGHVFGFLLAATAIWLIAATSSRASASATPSPPKTLLLSLTSGLGFGFYFVALRVAGSAGVIWPLAVSRVMSISICLLGLLLLTRTRRGSTDSPSTLALNRSAIRWTLCGAVFDTAGNLFFISATRAGRLDVAAVLSSLYPASTILLAAWLLRERFSARQGLGMALAAAAVILIML